MLVCEGILVFLCIYDTEKFLFSACPPLSSLEGKKTIINHTEATEGSIYVRPAATEGDWEQGDVKDRFIDVNILTL